MPSITPSLWFDNNLEEAAQFYTSIFPNSRIETFERYTEAGPGTPGDVVSGTFVLDGTRFIGINGGPQFPFSEAVSFTGRVQGPGRGRLLLGQAGRRRRRVAMRLAQGPIRAELADRSDPPVRADRRPGPGPRHGGDQGDAGDAQDRHRRTRGCGPLTVSSSGSRPRREGARNSPGRARLSAEVADTS